MFGHCADSQTVCRPKLRASFFKLWKFSPTGALALSHAGLGCRTGGPSWICTSCEATAIYGLILHVADAIAKPVTYGGRPESRPLLEDFHRAYFQGEAEQSGEHKLVEEF